MDWDGSVRLHGTGPATTAAPSARPARPLEGASAPGAPMSLDDLWASLKRKRFGATVLFLSVLAGAAAMGLTWPEGYESTAVVAVMPSSIDSPVAPSELNIATEQVIVTSRQVATIAAGLLGTGGDPGDLQDVVSVTVPLDSDALEISVTASDPDVAADTANAFAEGYLTYRNNEALAVAERSTEAIEQEIALLLDGESIESVSESVRSQVEELRSQQSTLAASVGTVGQIVTRAVAPRTPSSPGLVVFLGAGTAGGVLLAFVGALLLDRLDRRVGSADRLSRHVAARVLDDRRPAVGRLLRQISYTLEAARHDAGSTSATAPAVLLGTRVAMSDHLLLDLMRIFPIEVPQALVVVPEAGAAGVLRAVATQPRGALYVVFCQRSDRLADLLDVLRELAAWGRSPALVVITSTPRFRFSRYRGRQRQQRPQGPRDLPSRRRG